MYGPSNPGPAGVDVESTSTFETIVRWIVGYALLVVATGIAFAVYFLA